MTEPTIEIRTREQRFHTDLGWLDSRHSFNFGHHSDPAQKGFGLLLVNNDDRVTAGGGFGEHGHADMEIVTWVLSGSLAHGDSTGTNDVIYPGLAQRMSAGTGIRHSEMNASSTEPVHFVQMWVPPHERGIAPGYEQADVTDLLGPGAGLVAVASGQGHAGAVAIHQRDAVMWVARLSADETVALPEAPHVHTFVAVGSGTLVAPEAAGVTATLGHSPSLTSGSAIRLAGAGPVAFAAGAGGAELIVWETA